VAGHAAGDAAATFRGLEDDEQRPTADDTAPPDDCGGVASELAPVDSFIARCMLTDDAKARTCQEAAAAAKPWCSPKQRFGGGGRRAG